MLALSFPQSNRVFVRENCHDLPVYDSGVDIITWWQLNKEELEQIQKTGGVWCCIRSRVVFPMVLQVESPFIMPRPMQVASHAQCFVRFHEDNEIVLVQVEPEEYDFGVEPITDFGNDAVWHRLTCCIRNYEGRHATQYVFGEEVRVIGFSSELNEEYDYAVNELKYDPTRTLILERVNKTKRYDDAGNI